MSVGAAARLRAAASLFLRQHADDPVPWQPWGETPFADARSLDRPIVLRIGFASSAACMELARALRDDPAASALQSASFISILVDREEHPDVDRVYRSACRILTRDAAWPLHVFLTPEGKPFHAGAHFPASAEAGRPAWAEVLQSVADAWRDRRADVEEAAHELSALLRRVEGALGAPGAREGTPSATFATPVGTPTSGSSAFGSSAFGSSASGIPTSGSSASGIPTSGSSASGIPTSGIPTSGSSRERVPPDPEEAACRTLLARMDWTYGGFEGTPKFPMVPQVELLARAAALGDEDAEDALRRTLDGLSRGALFDAAGGGWHRCALAADWGEPSTGKLLADNGLLLRLFAEGERLLAPLHPDDGQVRVGVVDRCVAWLEESMRTPDGTFAASEICGGEATGVPTDERSPHVPTDARSPNLPTDESAPTASLGQRSGPHRDPRSLAAPNAWAVQGLARVALVRHGGPALALASATMRALLARHVDASGLLLRSADGSPRPALLEDWAAVLLALVDLYVASGDAAWIDAALPLADRMVSLHWDAAQGTLLRSVDLGALPCAPGAVEDEAEPAALPSAGVALLRLAALCGRADLEEVVDALRRTHASEMREMGPACATLLRMEALRREGVRTLLCVLPTGGDAAEPGVGAADGAQPAVVPRGPARGVPGGAVVSLSREEAQALFGPDASGRPAAELRRAGVQADAPPEAGSPEAGSPEAVSSEAVSSEAGSPEAVSPEAVSSEAVSSEAGSPEAVSPEAVSPESQERSPAGEFLAGAAVARARRRAAPHLAPDDLLCIVQEGRAPRWMAEPLVAGRRALDGRPTWYVCAGGQCSPPMHALDEVEILREA